MFSNANVLFDGDHELFKEVVSGISLYAEYGSGLSTCWVYKNATCDIYSVDTSEDWVNHVAKSLLLSEARAHFEERLKIKFVDLGVVGNWGRPLSYMYCDRFADYTNQIWQQQRKPELVLIDGRFRVCCFLTSLKYGLPGTKILFDDYTNRPHYHFIEKYVQRESTCGRQALFIVPDDSDLDLEELEIDISRFRYVME